MEQGQLALLPQRLRKKQSYRNSQSSLHSYEGSLSARSSSQGVWRPAGCHSVHTNGVEGVHHPFSRPSSPSHVLHSCISEASRSYDKENEVPSIRTSRIFKQSKPQDTHLQAKASTALQGQHRMKPQVQANFRQGILHLPGVSHTQLYSRSSCSPSPRSSDSRPALCTISNHLHSRGQRSILQLQDQQQGCTGTYSPCQPYHGPVDTSRPASLGWDVNRRLSCGSGSSCSGYTPGARGMSRQEYVSPLKDGLYAQQMLQPHLSPTMQHPPSPYLHALAREIEQQSQQQQHSGTGHASFSPLASASGRQQHQSPVLMTGHVPSQQQPVQLQEPQPSPSVERASSPMQLLDDTAVADAAEAFYSPIVQQQTSDHQQQYHLTPCYEDPEEYDVVTLEECFSRAAQQHLQECRPVVEEHGLTTHCSEQLMPQRLPVLGLLVTPEAASCSTARMHQLAQQQDAVQQDPSDVAEPHEQQQTGQRQGGSGAKELGAKHLTTYSQDVEGHDRSSHDSQHASYDQEPQDVMQWRALERQHQHTIQQSEQPHTQEPRLISPEEECELLERRQQWRAHQQQQQHQRWLNHMELQQQQPVAHQGDAVICKGTEQQQPQELPATASPAAAAAASALADYRRIIGEAQAMAQKSEAAWAQLNKYHQQRVCGRLPGSTGSTSRVFTPTPLTASRQLSRMGRTAPTTAAAGTQGCPIPAAAAAAVSPTPCKTLGSTLLHIGSPAVYHTPRGELSSSGSSYSSYGSMRKVPLPPPAFLCQAATQAAAASKPLPSYRRHHSVPGSPAAMNRADDSSSALAQDGSNPSMARQLTFGAPPAKPAMQSISSSLDFAQTASAASSLRGSTEATPCVLPTIPSCSSLATQPTGIRAGTSTQHGGCGNSSCASSDAVSKATSRQATRAQACSPLPCSPAWSMYLTPSGAEPLSEHCGDTAMARGAGVVGAEQTGSKAAWWRTPDDAQQQATGQACSSAGRPASSSESSAGISPMTCVRPKDLMLCFESAEQQANAAVASAVPGSSRASAAVHGAVGGSSSGCSDMAGFPFTPGSGHRRLHSDGSSCTSHQMQHAASASATEVLCEGPGTTAEQISGNSSAPRAAGLESQTRHRADDLAWLQKYLDAKAAAVIRPDSGTSSLPAYTVDSVDTSLVPAAAQLGKEAAGCESMTQEVWCVHNNWVATGMDAVADSIDAAPAAIALCSLTEAVRPPGTTVRGSSSAEDTANTTAKQLATAAESYTPVQQVNTQVHSIGPSNTATSKAATPAGDAAIDSSTLDDLENVSPLLDSLTPAQALAAYTQLAHKLKKRMDETAGGLLARLNLNTPVSADCSRTSSTNNKLDSNIELGSAEVTDAAESGNQEGVLAQAVTTKQDVGMVVLSPHTACGRWQSSRAGAD